MPAPSPAHRLSTLATVPTMDHLYTALEIARNKLDVAVQQPWVLNDTDPYNLTVVCSSSGNAPEWTLQSGLGHTVQTIWVHQTGDAGLICNLLASELAGGVQFVDHQPGTYATLSNLNLGDGENQPLPVGTTGATADGDITQPVTPLSANMGGLAAVVDPSEPVTAGGLSNFLQPSASSAQVMQPASGVPMDDPAQMAAPAMAKAPNPFMPAANGMRPGELSAAQMEAQQGRSTGQNLFNAPPQPAAQPDPSAQPFRPLNPYAQQLELGQNLPESMKQTADLADANPFRATSKATVGQPAAAPKPPNPGNIPRKDGAFTNTGMNLPAQPAPAANPFGHIAQNQPAQPRPVAPVVQPEQPTEHRFASAAPSAPGASNAAQFASLSSGDATAAFSRPSHQDNAGAMPFGGFAPPTPGMPGSEPSDVPYDPFAAAHDPFAQSHNPFGPGQRQASSTAPSLLESDASGVRAVGSGSNFSGNLKDTGAAGILQAMASSGAEGRLDVTSDHYSAQVYFEGGEPVHATAVDIVGDPAILEFMTWSTGSFEFKAGEKTPQRSVRSSVEKLINDGVTLAERYQRLLTAGLKVESYMTRKANDLTESEFEKAIDKNLGLNLNQQKWFYQQIDSKSSLLDILRRHSMPRAQWVPLLLSLVNSDLISLGAVTTTTVEGRQLESTAIDQELIASAAAFIREESTGLVTYPMFLYFLQQEYSRFDRHNMPFAVVVFELAMAKDGQVLPLTDVHVLDALTTRWQQIVRPFDVIAHYGETQYALLLPYSTPSEAVTVTERVVASLTEVDADGGIILFASGVASIPADCRDPEHMLTACAEALKVSKLKDQKVVAYQSLYV